MDKPPQSRNLTIRSRITDNNGQTHEMTVRQDGNNVQRKRTQQTGNTNIIWRHFYEPDGNRSIIKDFV